MPAVSIRDVSKKFRIFKNERARLKEALSFGRKQYGRDFWALRDINLDVEPGTTLGIIGRNGAGKSTLLSIVSGILQPTSGSVEVNGRLVALGQQLHLTTLLLPLDLVPQLLFTLGLSYLMAVAGTYVPDIRETLRAVIRATFFITPILWPAGRVPEEWSFLVDYNPLAVLVNAYRDLIINGELPGVESAMWFSLFAAALFVVGLVVFNRVKHNFADLL